MMMVMTMMVPLLPGHYYSFQVHDYHDNGAEHDDDYGRSYVSDPGVDDKKRNDQKTCFV